MIWAPDADVRDSYAALLFRILDRLCLEEREFFYKEKVAQDDEDAIMAELSSGSQTTTTTTTDSGSKFFELAKKPQVSYFTRLLDLLVSLIPKSTVTSQNSGQFYGLIQTVLERTEETRRYAVSRGYLLYFAHWLTGYRLAKPKPEDEKKLENMQARLEVHMINLFNAFSVLLRCFTFPGDRDTTKYQISVQSNMNIDVAIPSEGELPQYPNQFAFTPNLGRLPKDWQEFISTNYFIPHWMSANYLKQQSFRDLMKFFAWENTSMSSKIGLLILRFLDTQGDGFDVPLDTLKDIMLSMNDQLHVRNLL